MGYLHINNLYKDRTILMFRECYALEKIHGVSTHLTWKPKENQLHFFSSNVDQKEFIEIFDKDIKDKFANLFNTDITVYGEAYGSLQAMANSYGNKLRFVAFDVNINGFWLEVPKAQNVCDKLNIEFVDWVVIPTDIESINFERDRPSTQAKRNGIIEDKIREGVILRPLIEFMTKNGDRLIIKHKRNEFMETKTPREVDDKHLKVLEDAKDIADEWVTEMRLKHVLDKLPPVTISDMKLIITEMIKDIYREAKGEIMEGREVERAIANKTAKLFKNIASIVTPVPGV